MTTQGKMLAALVTPLWEKQPGETVRAYQHFRVYRDLPRRSLARVAQIQGVAPSSMQSLVRTKRWDERAQAYDAWLDKRHLAVTEAAVRSEAVESQRRIREIVEVEYQIWKAGSAKILELIAAPVNPQSAHRDAAGLARELNRLGRLSLGLHTDGGRQAPEPPGAKGADIDAFLDSLGSEAEGAAVEPVPKNKSHQKRGQG